MKRISVLCVAAATVAWGAYGARAATVCVEAESTVTNEAPMVLVRADAPPPAVKVVDGASGSAYLEVPLGVGKATKVRAGMARIAVEIPADGAYTVWFRTCWDGECSNTFQVQIDNQPPFLVGADATYHAWHWVKYPVSKMTAPPPLTRGPHTLTIIHREDGVRLDQVLLTTSPRMVPVGTEKAGVRP